MTTPASLSAEARRWHDVRTTLVGVVDETTASCHNASRRLAHAKEALEETIAELYGQNAVVGKNAEERDACIRRLTAAERYEVREAEDALAIAQNSLDFAERRLKQHDTEWRVIALQAQLLYPPLMTVPAAFNPEAIG